MNLPLGTSMQKSKFFDDVGMAMSFLSLYYALTIAEQQELNDYLKLLFGKVAARTK